MPRLVLLVFALVAALIGFVAPVAANDRAKCFQRNADIDGGIAACTRLIASRKLRGLDLASAYAWRGDRFQTKQDNDRALDDFNEAIRLAPKQAILYRYRGASHRSKRDYERAIADYNEAIRLNPKDTFSHIGRGITYAAKGDNDRAISDYNEALRRDGKSVEAYLHRGFAYLQTDKIDWGIRDLDEVTRLDARDPHAYRGRGGAYHARGDYDRAISEHSEAIRLDPNGAAAYATRGFSYGAKREFARALSDYNEAIRLDQNSAVIYSGRGFVHANAGDYDRAIADYNEAIRIDAKYANAYAHRGDAFRRKGDLDRAARDIEEAIRLDPKYPFAFTYRGLLHEEKRDGVRARDDFTAALALPLKGSREAHDIARQRLAAAGAAPAAAPVPAAPAAVAPVAPTPATPVALPAPAAMPAELGRRVALVIGNGSYRHATQLTNPGNDADDVARALRTIGFDVVEGRDLDKRGTEDKLREFSRKLAGAKLAAFFYAGHGMQVAGRNYLVPIDAKLEQPGDLRLDTIDIADVLAQMEAEQRVNLVFLDACRDNPLARSFARSLGTRSTTVGQGLAMIQSAIGTMIAYATQPDAVALDGDGRNSPFTTALLKHIATPGLDISSVMRRVRADVITTTSQRQVPWDHSSLIGDVVLVR